MAKPDEDLIDDLVDPVCHIADLKPSNDWPDNLKSLVGYARRVKEEFGFHVETISLR